MGARKLALTMLAFLSQTNQQTRGRRGETLSKTVSDRLHHPYIPDQTLTHLYRGSMDSTISQILSALTNNRQGVTLDSPTASSSNNIQRTLASLNCLSPGLPMPFPGIPTQHPNLFQPPNPYSSTASSSWGLLQASPEKPISWLSTLDSHSSLPLSHSRNTAFEGAKVVPLSQRDNEGRSMRKVEDQRRIRRENDRRERTNETEGDGDDEFDLDSHETRKRGAGRVSMGLGDIVSPIGKDGFPALPGFAPPPTHW